MFGFVSFMNDFDAKYQEASRLLRIDAHKGIDAFIALLSEVDPYDHESSDGISLVLDEVLHADDASYVEGKISDYPSLEHWLSRMAESLRAKNR